MFGCDSGQMAGLHVDNHEALAEAMSFSLPFNYNFEIPKTLKRIADSKAKCVLLQLPEGLLQFATNLSTLLSTFSRSSVEVLIFAEPTYGACCVDDFICLCLKADLLVHYGHSCLISIADLHVASLYIFLEVVFDIPHFVETIHRLLLAHKKRSSSPLASPRKPRVAFMSTIQFRGALSLAVEELERKQLQEDRDEGEDVTAGGVMDNGEGRRFILPQLKPLSEGEVLGCTSSVQLCRATESARTAETEGCQQIHREHGEQSKAVDFVVFVSDGRFHLEAAMIANPSIPFFRYDPFTKEFLSETYAHSILHSNRREAIEKAKKSSGIIALILSTLGRQGSVGILENLQTLLERNHRKFVVILMSEILPKRLALFKNVECFIQVGCPRLSIDWGHFYCKPLLSPYEAYVAFGNETYRDVYPMDFYSKDGNIWTNYGLGKHRNGTLEMPRTDKKNLLRRKLLQYEQTAARAGGK